AEAPRGPHRPYGLVQAFRPLSGVLLLSWTTIPRAPPPPQERVTFGPRFSRKSLSRAFASGSACAIDDISASMAKPASGVISAMRGSACITAKLVIAVL